MTEPVPWNYIYNQVKARIPNAPDALIRQQVFATMIDFTFSTNVWIEEVPFTAQSGVNDYPLLISEGRPARLMVVFDPTDPTKKWVDNGITMRLPGIVHLSRPPNEDKDWVAAIAKMCGTYQMDTAIPPQPTGYPEVDPWIVTTYGDTIIFGVLGHLQAMPAKPFRDPAMSAVNTAYYSSGKSEVRVNNMRGNVFGGQAWAYPQGFATITRKGWA